MLSKDLSRSQCTSRVNVMSAGVHYAFVLRTVLHLVQLFNRQSVHICTDNDCFAITNIHCYAGSTNSDLRCQTKVLERIRDKLCSFCLFETQFWVGMNVASVPHKVILDLSGLCEQFSRR